MSGATSDRRLSVDDVRQHIINSLFWKKDESGTADETLISFLKVYEEEPGDKTGPKTRYLMLAGESGSQRLGLKLAARSAREKFKLTMAVTKMGKVVIHKAKRNANLSFSKGKTWNLEDMRVLEVIGVCQVDDVVGIDIVAHRLFVNYDNTKISLDNRKGEGAATLLELCGQGV